MHLNSIDKTIGQFNTDAMEQFPQKDTNNCQLENSICEDYEKGPI